LITYAGEARRRKKCLFTWRFSIKVMLYIDGVVLVSTVCLFLVDSPSISLGDQAKAVEGVLNERVPFLISCH
jgi:hypothetical protein